MKVAELMYVQWKTALSSDKHFKLFSTFFFPSEAAKEKSTPSLVYLHFCLS